MSGPFLTLAEYEDRKGTVGVADRQKVATLIADASDELRGATRQTVTRVTEDAVNLVGTWAPALILPERPVVAVTAVALNGTTLVADSDWVFDGSDRLYRGSRESQARGHWGGPTGQVAVTYTHGWDPVPDSLKALACELVAAQLANPVGVVQKSIGAYSVTYGTAALRSSVYARARRIVGR